MSFLSSGPLVFLKGPLTFPDPVDAGGYVTDIVRSLDPGKYLLVTILGKLALWCRQDDAHEWDAGICQEVGGEFAAAVRPHGAVDDCVIRPKGLHHRRTGVLTVGELHVQRAPLGVSPQRGVEHLIVADHQHVGASPVDLVEVFALFAGLPAEVLGVTHLSSELDDLEAAVGPGAIDDAVGALLGESPAFVIVLPTVLKGLGGVWLIPRYLMRDDGVQVLGPDAVVTACCPGRHEAPLFYPLENGV